jgi:hypothetical protein
MCYPVTESTQSCVPLRNILIGAKIAGISSLMLHRRPTQPPTVAQMVFCEMCGARSGDGWTTHPSRKVALSVKPRAGDASCHWTICDECQEGLQNTTLPKPDQVWLLSQIRRATIDDQRVVLDWLLKKFKS